MKIPKHVIRFGQKFGFQFTVKSVGMVHCIGRTADMFYTCGTISTDKDRTIHFDELSPGKRFPYAERFDTVDEASIECDFWKLVLNIKYCFQFEFCNADPIQFAIDHGRDLAKELETPERWSQELQDFIARHEDALFLYRSLHKNDSMGHNALKSENPLAREWGLKRINAQNLQSSLEKLDLHRCEVRLSAVNRVVKDAIRFASKALEAFPMSASPHPEIQNKWAAIRARLESGNLAELSKNLAEFNAFVNEVRTAVDKLDAVRPSFYLETKNV
jgi:hypothetical protein